MRPQEHLVQYRARALQRAPRTVRSVSFPMAFSSARRPTRRPTRRRISRASHRLPRQISRMRVQHEVALTHTLAHRVEARPFPEIHVDDIRRPSSVPLDVLEVVTRLVQPRSTRHSKRMSPNVLTWKLQRNCRKPKISLHLNATKHAAVRHGEHRIDDQSRHKPSSTPMRATSSTRARF